ncbi:UPF0182 family protein [Arcanobacterium hippocoleae]
MSPAENSHPAAQPNPPRPPRNARNTSRGGGLKGGAFVPTLIILAAILFLLVVFAAFWTELRWFEQIQALRVFWMQYGAFVGIAAVGVIVLFAFLAVSAYFAFSDGAKSSANDKSNARKKNAKKNRMKMRVFRLMENSLNILCMRQKSMMKHRCLQILAHNSGARSAENLLSRQQLIQNR